MVNATRTIPSSSRKKTLADTACCRILFTPRTRVLILRLPVKILIEKGAFFCQPKTKRKMLSDETRTAMGSLCDAKRYSNALLLPRYWMLDPPRIADC